MGQGAVGQYLTVDVIEINGVYLHPVSQAKAKRSSSSCTLAQERTRHSHFCGLTFCRIARGHTIQQGMVKTDYYQKTTKKTTKSKSYQGYLFVPKKTTVHNPQSDAAA